MALLAALKGMNNGRFRIGALEMPVSLVAAEACDEAGIDRETALAALTGGTGFVGSHLVDTLCAAGLRPRVLVRDLANPRWIGGADASASCSLASSETYGQLSSSALPEARFMAKARHVGTPHSLQFVFGRSLKI